ncbi:MAG: hypothetical protein B1H11_03680 [Desulfobacteraceae bacterium 4484_190.1]|nr:MAG: hypothetical protein B1H11_03680 [Desulfobacteraceae bacterium 4484_190.1]
MQDLGYTIIHAYCRIHIVRCIECTLLSCTIRKIFILNFKVLLRIIEISVDNLVINKVGK